MELQNTSGLVVRVLENGTIGSIEVPPVRISMQPGSVYSLPGTNLYLRKRNGDFIFTPLTGPQGKNSYALTGNSLVSKGSWEGIDYTCTLSLSEKKQGWQWSIHSRNNSGNEMELDTVYLQDAGLKATPGAINNEHYVSQYVERRILMDPRYGNVALCRQNMIEAGGNPWMIIACENSAVSAGTDGMQFYGKSFRKSGIPEGLTESGPSGECAGESSLIFLTEKSFRLKPGEEHLSIFAALYLPDHPEASSASDLTILADLFSSFEKKDPVTKSTATFQLPEKNIFYPASFLPSKDLNTGEIRDLFGTEIRHPEYSGNNLLSFFYGPACHVVLQEKEIKVDRPHGHIMQARTGLVPDESMISFTAFGFGIFNSHMNQGNTNFNTFLSIAASPFNLSLGTGQRIFIIIDGKRWLLGVPSAFEMGLNYCRWIYKHENGILQVRSWASPGRPTVYLDIRVLSGEKCRIMITHEFDSSNHWKVSSGEHDGEFIVRPSGSCLLREKYRDPLFRFRIQNPGNTWRTGGEEMIRENTRSGRDNYFTIEVSETHYFGLSIIGEITQSGYSHEEKSLDSYWETDRTAALSSWINLSCNLHIESPHKDIRAIQEILPWFGMNALTHYLTPYGLEQFSGAAWGTRDVSQGPFDLLLSLGKYPEARKVLLIIFSNQNPDGGWPQWWMFDRYFNIRADHSHGDVFYWCIMALSNYLRVTGDKEILREMLPYFHEKGPEKAEKSTLSEHVDRLVNMIIDSFIPGTSLVPYGNGDWNDSLQPVSKDLARRMISSWTVEMNYQAFTEFETVCRKTGFLDIADRLKEVAGKIRKDFNKYLVKNGIVAGYGLSEDDGSIRVLLHPDDTVTGIRYSLLPMNRGTISGIFTRKQSLDHQEIISRYLKGPDGARLMDRPLPYKGGLQTFFQRAESSTFFGREIGLMYVHEHIRYAESLAITGKAEEFVKALRQAIPVDYSNIVPSGDLRQANCYYSSSDVTFSSRYEADELYEKILTGEMSLKGGWRVYSSGPGIFIGLVLRRLLGVQTSAETTCFDPVLPFSMSGLRVSLTFFGHKFRILYFIEQNTHSPVSITINNKEIRFKREKNRYRPGGALIKTNSLMSSLSDGVNEIVIRM